MRKSAQISQQVKKTGNRTKQENMQGTETQDNQVKQRERMKESHIRQYRPTL